MSNNKKRVLVLGASGLLGSELLSGAYFKDWSLLGQGRGADSEFRADLLNLVDVEEMLKKACPSAIINLVGLTNVDLCEQEPNESYKVNVRTLQNVITCCQKLAHQPRLIHISTDQVYDGVGPHKEDAVTLTNYYAFSKYMAELVACSVGAMVLRTNFLGRSKTHKRKSLTDWLYDELSNERAIQVFDDVQFSPLSMKTLCQLIEFFISSSTQGIFNLGTHGGMSKADFAFNFAELLHLPTSKMNRVSLETIDFFKAYRPKDMRLNISALESAVGITLPTLAKELEQIVKEYEA